MKIGSSGFLENRKEHLCKFPQMAKEQRWFHLGIDLDMKAGEPVLVPIDGVIVLSEYEQGDGNYGGMCVLQCEHEGSAIYIIFGHLAIASLPKAGEKFRKGEQIATIGTREENGNWFEHLHIQELTQKGFDNGWVYKGYCSQREIDGLDEFCINPSFVI